MSGFSHVIWSIYILGYILCCSVAWQVKMPRHIKGLLNSCLVIPCSFDYYWYPPRRPDRVVWYKYESHGYPLVYDSWYPNDVIYEFRGETERFHDSTSKTCSLKIYPVTSYHHRQKIYPWVDPENVGKGTYRFFDTTVTIEVKNAPEKPLIMTSGDMKVGKSVQVQCSVEHTCPPNPPTMTLNFPLQNRRVYQSCRSDGICTTTLTSTLDIKSDHQIVTCSVRHTGGLTATTSVALNAECSFSPLTISPSSGEFLEGHASKVTCTASYTCSKHVPVLTWNYEGMPASTDTKEIAKAQWRTVSTLTFTASGDDNGRSLICSATFSGGRRQEERITLRVKRNMLSLGWSFTTPGSITGMRGSCIIIPCSFTYSKSQPADLHVIWYLYKDNEYPRVYDPKQSVITQFEGITNLIGSVTERNCSLKIEKLEMMHNQERLYPWIDEHPITSYHFSTTKFSDKSTQLIVTDQAQEPQMSIIDVPRVGEQSRVSCSIPHTCVTAPPILTLNGVNGQDVFLDSLVSDGIWQRTIERTWMVEETDQSVTCTVSYHGGQKATSELKLSVECPYEEIKMVEPPGATTEGVAKSVICSVSYKCKKNKPAIVWNYKDMQSSLHIKDKPNSTFNIQSNLTFIGSLDDNGKSLTCTAVFTTGNTSASETLRVKDYDEPVEESHIKKGSDIPARSANVPFKLQALTRSCVVIPCSFQQQDMLFTRGIWEKKAGGIIYHNGQSYVVDHFKGRTRMLGDLNNGNCSLEIDDIKPFDNGPFCFHGQQEFVNHRFNNSCVFIVMKASPEKPVMSSVPAEVDAGSVLSVSCSVTHTCLSHPPVFSWSVQNITSEVTHSPTTQGIWETTSSITFMVASGDSVKSLTCTAIFWRDKQQASTVKLNVKGSLKGSLAAVISFSTVVLIVILAVVFGVYVYRKRKHADDSLEPPPRPEKRRSLWDRLSRRYPEDRERPPRPEKRRSIWSRFSGRAEDGRVGWNNERKPRQSFWSRFSRHQGNAANLSVGYVNNTTTLNYDQHISKPRFPSPKDKRRNPCTVKPQVNSAMDYQVYGNI